VVKFNIEKAFKIQRLNGDLYWMYIDSFHLIHHKEVGVARETSFLKKFSKNELLPYLLSQFPPTEACISINLTTYLGSPLN
jgi:hypothetical protein